MRAKLSLRVKKLTEEYSQQNRIVELLEDLLKWIKASAKPTMKKIFEENIQTDTEKLVYNLSDGKSSPAIASIVGIDSSTVRDYWKKWADAGMMEICPNYKRRYCKIFSLSELGIEVPDTKEEQQSKEENEDE